MVYFTPFQEVINVSMQLANYCFMFILMDQCNYFCCIIGTIKRKNDYMACCNMTEGN